MTSTKKVFDERGFDWLNESYSARSGSVASDRLAKLVPILTRCGRTKLLDVGCGDGRFLKCFPNAIYRLGIDYSSSMMELCKGYEASNFQFLAVDANSLSELSNIGEVIGSIGFDQLSMLGVIHYLKDPLATLQSLTCQLEKGALVAVTFRNALFNINEYSRYHHSPITKLRHAELSREISFWDRLVIGNRVDGPDIIIPAGHAPAALTNGINDLYWNPDNHEYWRQFTIDDSISLFRECHIVPEALVLLNASNPSGDGQQPCSVCRFSSFALIGRSD